MNRQEMMTYFDEPAMPPREAALMRDIDKATRLIREAQAALAKMGPAAIGVGQVIIDAEAALECALNKLQAI